MEIVIKRPHGVKKELKNEVDGGGGTDQERFIKVSPSRTDERSSTNTSGRPSSNSKDSSTISQEDQIESTKAEIGEVKEENQRLKNLLSQIVKDYQSLQMHFFDIVKQEQPNLVNKEQNVLTTISTEAEETELVSLRLGMNTIGRKKKLEESMTNSNPTSKENGLIEEGLTLGLDSKFEGYNNKNYEYKEVANNISTSDDSVEEIKEKEEEEEKSGKICQENKVLKNSRCEDEEVLQQTHVKKARVSVRVRCQTPTMNDGCQWRKYGQKIAKGNPCPRAYYRCTVAPACPVRKQVQRCAEDMSILITTYEGNHNHPLPISATAMASTTSAAASMLLTGSSTSLKSPPITNVTSNLHNLNFTQSNSSKISPFYLPNTTISPSPSYSTITLDLTSSQSPQFNKFPSNSSFSISMPSSLSTKSSYITSDQFYKPSYQHDTLLQPYLHSSNSNVFTDSIAKAITSDPSFQSVLQAAINSYVGGSSRQIGEVFQSGSSSQQGSLIGLVNNKNAGSESAGDIITWEKMKGGL